MANTSTNESRVSEALRELSMSDAGPLELERKGNLGRTEWKRVWLAFHLDAWAIKRGKDETVVPSGAKRWRGAERLKLRRHEKSTVEKCSSAEDEGPRVCFVVRCSMGGEEILEHRFRAETETCADWWCWALKAKVRPWDELFKCCGASTFQAPERSTSVTRLDGDASLLLVSAGESEGLRDT